MNFQPGRKEAKLRVCGARERTMQTQARDGPPVRIASAARFPVTFWQPSSRRKETRGKLSSAAWISLSAISAPEMWRLATPARPRRM